MDTEAMVPPCGLWQEAQPAPVDPGLSVALYTPCVIACEGVEAMAMATITVAVAACMTRARSAPSFRAAATFSSASFTDFPCFHALLPMERVWHKELPIGASLNSDNSLISLDLVHADDRCPRGPVGTPHDGRIGPRRKGHEDGRLERVGWRKTALLELRRIRRRRPVVVRRD